MIVQKTGASTNIVPDYPTANRSATPSLGFKSWDTGGLNNVTNQLARRTFTANDALAEMKKRLNVPTSTILKYADPKAYAMTDQTVQKASRIASEYGFRDIYDLAAQYKSSQNKTGTANQIGIFNRQTVRAADPNALPAVEVSIGGGLYSGLIRNDAKDKGFYVTNNNVIISGQSQKDGFNFATLSIGRDPTQRYLLPLPEKAGADFRKGYQQGTLALGGQIIQDIAPAATTLRGSSRRQLSKPSVQTSKPATSYEQTMRQTRERLFANPYSNSSLGRNVAIADYRVTVSGRELNGRVETVSGKKTPAGAANLPENPVFIAGSTGKHDRSYDTERVSLENISARLSVGKPTYVTQSYREFNRGSLSYVDKSKQVATYPQVKGEVNLVTERPACLSCFSVIQQFKTRFPNVKLNLINLGAK